MSFRFTTAGESHGPGLTAVVEGLPAGLELTPEDIDRDLARRQLGHGRGGRMKIEKDRAEVTSGVRHGRTLGSPVALRIDNRDYANWEERMNPWPVDGRGGRGAPAAPRPRRPGRRPEVRLHRRAQRARARERPRDRRARGRRRAGQGLPARARRRGAQPRGAHRLGHRAGARDLPGPADFEGVDESPVRCLDDGRERRDGRRDRRGAARPTSRSAASSRCARSGWFPARARTSPGRSAWTGAWRRRSCRSRR